MITAHLPETSGIYRIDNSLNGKLYVGSAVNLRKRLREHVRRLQKGDHRNPRLQASWAHHGAAVFTVVVLEHCSPADAELLERETAWIDVLEAGQPARGYNICPVGGTRRGAKMSAESCARIGVTKLGNTNRLGQSHGPDTRARIAASLTGRIASIETRVKLSTIRSGKPKTAAWSAKIGAAQRGKVIGAEQRAAISATLTGRKIPAEVIAKRSATVRTKHQNGYKRPSSSPEARAKQSAAVTGRKLSDETRAKMSAAHEGKSVSPQHREKIAASMRAVWARRRST